MTANYLRISHFIPTFATKSKNSKMKQYSKYALGLLAISIMACEGGETSPAELKTLNDSVSYSYGVRIAEDIKSAPGNEINAEVLAKAIVEAMADKSQLTQDQCQAVVMRQSQQMESEKLKEGMEYLEENKKKDGVVTTESGLQYKVLKSGEGKTPTAKSEVTVHYTGKFIDGTVFDSSVERGEPARFPVNGVIRGWTEALQLMKEGDKWELVIPSELAYGRRGQRSIPPNSALIFEVELILVNE